MEIKWLKLKKASGQSLIGYKNNIFYIAPYYVYARARARGVSKPEGVFTELGIVFDKTLFINAIKFKGLVMFQRAFYKAFIEEFPDHQIRDFSHITDEVRYVPFMVSHYKTFKRIINESFLDSCVK